jgi:hypothetical protein
MSSASSDAQTSLPCASPATLLPNVQNRVRTRPFGYTSASSVITRALAEVGSAATDYVLNNSHHVPFLHHKRFNSDLLSHISTLHRGSSDFVRAHRICAGLSSYMLFPCIVLLLLALSWRVRGKNARGRVPFQRREAAEKGSGTRTTRRAATRPQAVNAYRCRRSMTRRRPSARRQVA